MVDTPAISINRFKDVIKLMFAFKIRKRQAAEAGGWQVWATSRWTVLRFGKGGGEWV